MPVLQVTPFLERLLAFLIPYFTGSSFAGITADLAAARAEALETLASYGARTRAELLCAVQIIVFSFAALETLAEANTPEMSPSMRLRYRGCANNLNRHCQKTEQTLAKRLACDVPEPTDFSVEPAIDVSDADVEEIMRQSQAAIQDYCDRAAAKRSTGTRTTATRTTGNRAAAMPTAATLTAATPAAGDCNITTGNPPAESNQPPQSREEQNKRLWGAAMMDTLARMGMPIQPVAGAIPASDGADKHHGSGQ